MTNSLLDLINAPPVLFFFGLSGVGKSWVSQLVALHTGRYLYEADADLTAEMRQAIEDQRPFSDDMRDRFFHVMAEKIMLLRSQHGSLVISQGAYKQKHRRYLCSRFPELEFIWVSADSSVIESRLRARGDWISAEYAQSIAANFEEPDTATKKLLNNADSSAIVQQLRSWYSVR